jgi:murein DD-endopeptidase MepM/ murein hydrolase activator NlpD
VFSLRPARLNVLAGTIVVASVLAPTALSAGRPAHAQVAHAGGKGKDKDRPEPVSWLPRPNDRSAIRARSLESELKNDARRVRTGPVILGTFPIRGAHNYGTAENAFGDARPGHMHAGQDVMADEGTPLVAVRDGEVVEAGTDGGRGNYLVIYSHDAGKSFVYMHMVEPASVQTGDSVKLGQHVGAVGCTGSCSGSHLHFEVRQGKGSAGEAVDPLPLLKRWDG